MLKVLLVSIQINDTLKAALNSGIRIALPFNIPFMIVILADLTLYGIPMILGVGSSMIPFSFGNIFNEAGRSRYIQRGTINKHRRHEIHNVQFL